MQATLVAYYSASDKDNMSITLHIFHGCQACECDVAHVLQKVCGLNAFLMTEEYVSIAQHRICRFSYKGRYIQLMVSPQSKFEKIILMIELNNRMEQQKPMSCVYELLSLIQLLLYYCLISFAQNQYEMKGKFSYIYCKNHSRIECNVNSWFTKIINLWLDSWKIVITSQSILPLNVMTKLTWTPKKECPIPISKSFETNSRFPFFYLHQIGPLALVVEHV